MNARCWASVADAERASNEGHEQDREDFEQQVGDDMRKAFIANMQGDLDTEPAMVRTLLNGTKRLSTEFAPNTLHVRFTNDAVWEQFAALMRMPEAKAFLDAAAQDYVMEHAEDVAEQTVVER